MMLLLYDELNNAPDDLKDTRKHDKLMELTIKLAEIEERLLVGDSEKIQLGALIAAFQVARDMVKNEAKKEAESK